MSDVPHVEFSLQRKVKQSHMHATPSAWQGWMGGDMVSWGWAKSQLPHNLLLSYTTHTHTWMFTQFLTVKNCKYFSQSAQRLHSQRVTSENLGHLVSNPAPILWDKFWHIQQKHAHKQPNMSTRQWIQIGLNPPPTTTTWVHAIRGPADPLQPWQLYILRFYDLDLICECHRVAWKGSA